MVTDTLSRKRKIRDAKFKGNNERIRKDMAERLRRQLYIYIYRN